MKKTFYRKQCYNPWRQTTLEHTRITVSIVIIKKSLHKIQNDLVCLKNVKNALELRLRQRSLCGSRIIIFFNKKSLFVINYSSSNERSRDASTKTTLDRQRRYSAWRQTAKLTESRMRVRKRRRLRARDERSL